MASQSLPNHPSQTKRASHGATRGRVETPTYKTWKAMRERCSRKNALNYCNYGGRGITVCERWNSYENFLADMGEKPSPEFSIDRIDNDGNYEPSNCRWATRSEQRRNNRQGLTLLTARGRTQPITDWAKETGVPEESIGGRIRKGWDVERAIFQPVRKHNGWKLNPQQVSVIRHAVSSGALYVDLAPLFGVTPEMVSKISRGLLWPAEQQEGER